MLKAYLDESNSNLQGNVCVVAGFVGTPTQWETFENDWYPALHPKKRLHMKELRWTSEDREILARVGILPDQHGLRRIVSTVPNKAYRQFVEGKIRHHYANPYVLGVQMCVAQLLRDTALDSVQIAIFFEAHGVFKPRIADLNGVIQEYHRSERILSVENLPKGSCIAFEIADYLSYAVGQFEEGTSGPHTDWTRPILGDGSCIGLRASARDVEEIAAKGIKVGMGV
jgi:hypothetical protein